MTRDFISAPIDDAGYVDFAKAADDAQAEVEAEYAAMLKRVGFVRNVVAKGVKIQGACEDANRVVQGSYEALLEYVDWLETAIAVGRSQWESAHDKQREMEQVLATLVMQRDAHFHTEKAWNDARAALAGEAAR